MRLFNIILLLLIISYHCIAQKGKVLVISNSNGELFVDGVKSSEVEADKPEILAVEFGQHLLQVKTKTESKNEVVNVTDTKQIVVQFDFNTLSSTEQLTLQTSNEQSNADFSGQFKIPRKNGNQIDIGFLNNRKTLVIVQEKTRSKDIYMINTSNDQVITVGNYYEGNNIFNNSDHVLVSDEYLLNMTPVVGNTISAGKNASDWFIKKSEEQIKWSYLVNGATGEKMNKKFKTLKALQTFADENELKNLTSISATPDGISFGKFQEINVSITPTNDESYLINYSNHEIDVSTFESTESRLDIGSISYPKVLGEIFQFRIVMLYKKGRGSNYSLVFYDIRDNSFTQHGEIGRFVNSPVIWIFNGKLIISDYWPKAPEIWPDGTFEVSIYDPADNKVSKLGILDIKASEKQVGRYLGGKYFAREELKDFSSTESAVVGGYSIMEKLDAVVIKKIR